MASDPSPFQPRPRPAGENTETVFFDRRELDTILRLYGQMVARGEWSDYGLEQGTGWVAFLIYRRAYEHMLYRIEKRPALARRQGAFAVFNQAGVILKRGQDLTQVLRLFDRKRFDVME